MDLLIPPPSPPSYLLSSNMVVAAEEQTSRSGSGSSGGGGSGIWTQQENKMFENALAHFDIKTPDRFERVAAVLPGKTLRDVMSHYRDLEDDVNHIEAGLIPCPGYTSSSSSSFTLDWLKHHNPFCAGGKRRLLDQERKKGVPWTEEEHRLFLMGLKKYGKGDWRSISRNFVVTRTPTQVASHAQKYFIRLNSGGKDKRRASIHDITTLNLPENPPSSPSPPSGLTMPADLVETDHRNEAASRISMLKHGDRFAQLPYGIDPYAIKSEAQNPHRAMLI